MLNAAIVSNESDVEQKIVFPLLTSANYLAIPPDLIKTKSYLAPTKLDKASGRQSGYFPDYSIWMLGLPVLLAEAKEPSVAAQVGFTEACLYARHLNSRYPTGLNPCRFVLACNGVEVLAGYWDQAAPQIQERVADLGVETAATKLLAAFCQNSVLQQHSATFFQKVRIDRGERPYQLVGGQHLLNAKLPLNTFAADLSPVLRRYFSSTDDASNREIAERAYVSSAETTEYDRILEALLRDRVTPRRDTLVEVIRTTKSEEPTLTRAIRNYSGGERTTGELQLIQGAVGSGKSLFARRYRDLLEPEAMKETNYWSFVDFNGSPASLKNAERWLCTAFVKSFEKENPQLELYSESVLKGIFSKQIQQRRARYEMLRRISEQEEIRARADDISAWQSDDLALAEGIANYIVGSLRKNLIVVMDNVDKLDLQNQLDAFQLALWFMALSKGFIVLQMRDETYERYKNEPPLDTFRSGIAFHIAPPRFIDVVKRRLELGIEYLAEHAQERQEYILDNGIRVLLPKGELGNFLRSLYALIFGRRSNIARILEALAGRDVRKALEMFVSIVTSGHLSTSAITSSVRGEGAIPISEYHIIRIVMRTDYRFFSDNSGNISNIFHYENEWTRPDNFLLSEILFFLSMHRKQQGELGLEGYFSVRRICDEIQKLGYETEDVYKATNYLLRRQLIIADNFNFSSVGIDDCVRIQASGFIHLRILCDRLEYLYGIIPVVPVADNKVAAALADYVNREYQRGDLPGREKVRAVEILLTFLKAEMNRLRERNPFFEPRESGAVYVLRCMEHAIRRFWNLDRQLGEDPNQLDLV
jgi:hypothetical protein